MRSGIQTFNSLLFGFFWPIGTVAAATKIGLGATFSSYSFEDWVTLLFVILISGLAAFVNRIKRAYEAEKFKSLGEPYVKEDLLQINIGLFALFYALMSIMAGLLAFLMFEGLYAASGPFSTANYLEIAGVAVASYQGARFVDRFTQKFSDALLDRLPSVGITPKEPTQ